MVIGLDVFRAHFRGYPDRYMLIGGAACDLLLSAAGVGFRATKDLDIVICVEAFDAAFARAFWNFVRLGGYQSRESSSGARQFYRFQRPSAAGYPVMLELFARTPDSLQIGPDSHLTPIPVDDDVSSLSAILMDDDYYNFIRAGRTEREGVAVVGAEHLIPLKARAWLDLRRRREAGASVDSKVVKKHKNDVFRLYQIVDPERSSTVPETIQADLRSFVEAVGADEIDLQALGIVGLALDDVLTGLRGLYRLD